MAPGHRHTLMFAFTLHLFLSFMSRTLTIPMPEFLLFVLYHFSEFLFRVGSFVFCILCKGRSQVSAQHFILFAYPLGLLGACINQVFGVKKRKEVAITANGVLLRLAVKSITRWALEDKIRSFVPKEHVLSRPPDCSSLNQRNSQINYYLFAL